MIHDGRRSAKLSHGRARTVSAAGDDEFINTRTQCWERQSTRQGVIDGHCAAVIRKHDMAQDSGSGNKVDLRNWKQ